MKLLIVESPAKAKTINRYLGKDFKVLASYGHIRGLPSKTGSVLPDQQFKIIYETYSKSLKYIKAICEAAKKADCIFLATDPDREGEAISWHIVEELKKNGIIANNNCTVKRVVFNEITKKAINAAINSPRDLKYNLIDAQQARLALDYLVGFTLSPLLWHKLPGCKSAGRVQSVALRLVCDREEEILKFQKREFWDIKLSMLKENKQSFFSKLIQYNGTKLDKFSITTEEEAEKIKLSLTDEKFYVKNIEQKKQKRNPPPPFTTSSLQQEAVKKLGFSTKKTMLAAQKLYEGISVDGELTALITYIRTDSVNLSQDIIGDSREFISTNFGNQYLPKDSREYKTKVKNAQEAHEAIRPTNINLTPSSLEGKIEPDFWKLYDLIWKRTIACQMESVILNLVSVTFVSDEKDTHVSKATGSTIEFEGFYKLYRESVEDVVNQEDEDKILLPEFIKEEKVITVDIMPSQHFTEPLPRYTEASLVKKLEELGIGRPSTYVSIISVLQDRDYVKLEKKRFVPQDRGVLVTAFLLSFFQKYVEYDFTANLEDELDDIANGKIDWRQLLEKFWNDFYAQVEQVKPYTITHVVSAIEKLLYHHVFPADPNGKLDPTTCPSCTNGKLGLKIGKFGAFVACSNYPECKFHRTFVTSNNTKVEDQNDNNKFLGLADQNDENSAIYLKHGPYGWYIESKANDKPKRISLPQIYNPENVTLELGIQLSALPKTIGLHPISNKDIVMSIGRYGPYLKHEGKFHSIPKGFDLFSTSLEEYVNIIDNDATKRPRGKAKKA